MSELLPTFVYKPIGKQVNEFAYAIPKDIYSQYKNYSDYKIIHMLSFQDRVPSSMISNVLNWYVYEYDDEKYLNSSGTNITEIITKSIDLNLIQIHQMAIIHGCVPKINLGWICKRYISSYERQYIVTCYVQLPHYENISAKIEYYFEINTKDKTSILTKCEIESSSVTDYFFGMEDHLYSKAKSFSIFYHMAKLDKHIPNEDNVIDAYCLSLESAEVELGDVQTKLNAARFFPQVYLQLFTQFYLDKECTKLVQNIESRMRAYLDKTITAEDFKNKKDFRYLLDGVYFNNVEEYFDKFKIKQHFNYTPKATIYSPDLSCFFRPSSYLHCVNNIEATLENLDHVDLRRIAYQSELDRTYRLSKLTSDSECELAVCLNNPIAALEYVAIQRRAVISMIDMLLTELNKQSNVFNSVNYVRDKDNKLYVAPVDKQIDRPEYHAIKLNQTFKSSEEMVTKLKVDSPLMLTASLNSLREMDPLMAENFMTNFIQNVKPDKHTKWS